MKRFSQLLTTLILKNSRNDKISVMSEYFKNSPDPDRGYALGALTGTLSISGIKPNFLRTLVTERVNQELFNMSYFAKGFNLRDYRIDFNNRHHRLL